MLKNVKSWFNNIKKLFYIMERKHKIMTLILLIVVIINVMFQTLGVYAITPLVTSMTNKEAFLDSNIVNVISNIYNTSDYTKLFVILCWGIAVLYFIKEVVAIFQTWLSIVVAQKIQRDLSRTVLDSYLHKEYDFFLNYGTTKIMRDVKDDPTSVYNMLTCLINLVTEALTVTILLVYVVLSDYQMAICIAFLAFICMTIMIHGLKRGMIKSGAEARRYSAENQKALLEAVEGIKEVQVMKKQAFFSKAFFDSYTKAQKPMVFHNIAEAIPTNIVEGIFIIGIMCFLAFKAVQDVSFWTNLPVLASFLVAAIRMLPAIGRITNHMNNIQFCIPALESVFSNVKLIRENKLLYTYGKYGSRKIDFIDNLLISNVRYRYGDAEKDVLKNINLRINKGESVGIIGESGAGKSTLADILLGLHVPTSGTVSIDGQSIYDIPYEYGQLIGYVPQNIYLVDGSIRENVAFGIGEADIDDELVIEALKKAKLYDFVKNSEKGIETIVGERGVKFSGGQRQRLAIARALYRRPQIMILDEATSALDNATEATVMNEVEEMQGSITMIIIAHRLSTIEHCDHVYEIVDGRAVRRR